MEQHQLNWEVYLTDRDEEKVKTELESSEHTAYLVLEQLAIKESIIPVYTSAKISSYFMHQIQLLETPLKTWQLKQLGLNAEELEVIVQGILFHEVPAQELALGDGADAGVGRGETGGEEAMACIVPGAFAGIILLSIVFSGMYIFQSVSQEKKDKVAEIILSSVAPGELMQGKIIGYFALGMIQAGVFLGFAIPVAI